MPNKNKESVAVETECQNKVTEKKLELVSAEATVTNQEKMEHILDKMNIVAEKIKSRNKKKSKLSKI
ncbi:MAG TPA: hypothetical protein VII94_05950 [Candidatus Saccharimonadales bacterium]